MRASRWRDPLAAGARADDPLLGRGRNAQDPYRGLVSDEGKVEIPIDLRNFGHWLTGLFGDAARIAGADPTLATCTGTIKLRFDGATRIADRRRRRSGNLELRPDHGRGLGARS